MKPLSQLRIDFMGRRNLAFIVSAVMLIVSIAFITSQRIIIFAYQARPQSQACRCTL